MTMTAPPNPPRTCARCGQPTGLPGYAGDCPNCRRLETFRRMRAVKAGTATAEEQAVEAYRVDRRPVRASVVVACTSCGTEHKRSPYGKKVRDGQFRCRACALRDQWGAGTVLAPGSRARLAIWVDRDVMAAVRESSRATGQSVAVVVGTILADWNARAAGRAMPRGEGK